MCDGILNILQSGKKETSTLSTININEQNIQELLSTLSQYLTTYLNKGVYYGITGSYIDMIMRLDIGIAITVILLNATNNKANAFEAYAKSGIKDYSIIQQLLEWLFIN